MNDDLISREDLQIEITKQIAYFHDRANTTSIYDDKLAYNLKATGLELARVLIETAPAVPSYSQKLEGKNMNNDVIPVGTTVHINPEDIKWDDGDLISRETLKKAFTEECCGCCDNCSHCLTGYKCELIDNAPAVEAIHMDLHEKILDRTIRELFKCQEELEKVRNGERSQDEWVRKVDVIQSIAKQYSEHDELVPMWLSIGDMQGGAE